MTTDNAAALPSNPASTNRLQVGQGFGVALAGWR
jgi:hypothetical protein